MAQVQVVEHLPNKRKALSSNPVPRKKKKKDEARLGGPVKTHFCSKTLQL
jgi:hypothetical protein